MLHSRSSSFHLDILNNPAPSHVLTLSQSFWPIACHFLPRSLHTHRLKYCSPSTQRWSPVPNLRSVHRFSLPNRDNTQRPMMNLDNFRSPNTCIQSFPLHMYHHILHTNESGCILRSAFHPASAGPFFTIAILPHPDVNPNHAETNKLS